MKIRSLCIRPLEIPFKTRFKHNRSERQITQSVLVAARTASACLGLGEGCPREYVSGEDVSSCLRFFAAHREALVAGIHSCADLEQWVQQHETEIDKNPAAWCAVELALLDALSKELSQSVERTLDLPELAGTFQYTAVLGEAAPAIAQAQVSQYAALGMGDFKIKISGDPAVDDQKFSLVQQAVPGARLRLDANNLWPKAADALAYLEKISIQPFALEEPLQPMDYQGLLEIAARSPVPLILDESFLHHRHFASIAGHPGRFIINLRVSKMGGLIRSLRIARQAAQRAIPLIVGAQVGETSLLTRAALVIASAFREHIIAQEGAFGTLLLERDITAQPLVFGRKGILDPALYLDSHQGGLQMNYLLPYPEE